MQIVLHYQLKICQADSNIHECMKDTNYPINKINFEIIERKWHWCRDCQINKESKRESSKTDQCIPRNFVYD